MDKLLRQSWVAMIQDAVDDGEWYVRKRYSSGQSYYFHLGHRQRKNVVVRISDHKGNKRSGENLFNVVSDASLSAAISFLLRRPKRGVHVRPVACRRR